MGGSGENRHTPMLEHWSIAVKDGKALEKEWRAEIPIPRGGPHRFVNCTCFLRKIYVSFHNVNMHLTDYFLGDTNFSNILPLSHINRH